MGMILDFLSHGMAGGGGAGDGGRA